MSPSRRAVVVGAGVTGVLVGLALRKAGWAVELVEQLHVGAGSSSRTAAGIRQQFGTASTVRAMRHAVASYRALQEELGAPLMVSQGYLFLHGDAEAWTGALARVAVQRAAGLHEVEALEGAALRSRFPWVAESVVGGTFCPTDGFLRPEVIYGEGAARLRALGGVIHTGAEVVGHRASGDRLTAVQLADGTERTADLFVDATNAWTRRTAQALGATPLPVDPIKRHLWFLKREGPLDAAAFATMPLVISPSGVYARPENRDTLLMGWAKGGHAEPAFAPDDQDRVEPAFAHDAGPDAVPYEAWMRFAEAVPAAAELGGMMATTSGYYGVTPDHLPFLDYDPRRPNLLRLVGMSGRGLMLAPFTAAVALALAEAGRPLLRLDLPTGTVDLGDFAIGRASAVGETMVI